MDENSVSNRPAAKPNHETWARVSRLIAEHPAVKQVRLNSQDHGVTVGFYQAPSNEELDEIKSAVRRELTGDWDVSIVANGEFPSLHLHKISKYATEIHRDHPENEPPIIWKSILLPAWRNRPFPRPVPRDHRVMLVLAGLCGLSTLTGFVLERAGFSPALSAVCFAVAYVAGAWFATQDVWQGLKGRKIDIQFLMVAVAVGALFVKAWTEGATLLFLFSLSNGLEQFANFRTRKSIESLLKVAPKRALRRENGRWMEISVDDVEPADELLVKAGELFPVDGVMIEGATSADESALTGESIPVMKQIGDAVSGGTLNLDGQSVVRATRAIEDSALNRIVSLIEVAQQQKAPAQRFTDSFSRYYTWVALSLSAVVFAVLLLLQRPVRRRVLSRHDRARRRIALCARAVDPVGHSRRNRSRRAPRHFVSWRCSHRESGGSNPVCIRQNRDFDKRRAHSGENRLFQLANRR